VCAHSRAYRGLFRRGLAPPLATALALAPALALALALALAHKIHGRVHESFHSGIGAHLLLGVDSALRVAPSSR